MGAASRSLVHPVVLGALACTFHMGLLAATFARREPVAPATRPEVRPKPVEEGKAAVAKDAADLTEELRTKRPRIVESLWNQYKDDPRRLRMLREMTEEDFRRVGESALSPEESDAMVEVWRELHARAMKTEGDRR